MIVNSTINYTAVISKAANVEYVYPRNATGPSPYGRLPSNFTARATATRSRGVGAQAVPEPAAPPCS